MPGDFAKLQGLQQSLRELAQIQAKVAPRAAYKINELLEREYREGRDPYGKPWAALKPSTLARGRNPPPLSATGNMASKTRARALSGAGIVVEVPFPGVVHQYSKRVTLTRRPMLPTNTLPATWRAAIVEATNVELKLAMKR